MRRIEESGSSVPVDSKRELPEGVPTDRQRLSAKMLFEKGFGYKSVAAMLGLSPHTVRDWNRNYKRGVFHVKRSANQYRYPEESKQFVRDLRRQGLSWREISEHTGINVTTCRNWVQTKSDKGLKA